MPVEADELLGRLSEGAEDRGILVWEAFPYGAALVPWNDREDYAGFLNAAVRLGAQVLYLDEHVAGFAVAGIVHALDIRDEDDNEADAQAVAEAAADALLFSTGRSWRSATYEDLRKELQVIVDAVVADHDYDTYRGDSLTVLVRHGEELSGEDFALVKSAARARYDDTVGRVLDAEAERLAPKVVQHPDFDPLVGWDEIEAVVVDILGLEEPRLVRRVADTVSQLSDSMGLRERAVSQYTRAAAEVLASLPPLLLDQVGFATRPAQRENLLAPALEQRTERERQHLPAFVDLAMPESARQRRERRYATAARLLMARGQSKAGSARVLGISTSVIDRLLREHREDVLLSPEDPIRVTLAPEI